MDQDLENVFSRYFFLDGLLLEFHVKFRAAKFPDTLHLTLLTDHTDPEI